MRRVPVDPGVELAYEIRGDGHGVLLIHGGLCADSFAGLMHEPALRDYRLVRPHRVGYDGSTRVAGAVGIDEQAAHVRTLLEALGIARVHVVGHSSGAAIALQLALDHPDVVTSVVLLEAALLIVPSGPFAGEAMRFHRDGDDRAAVDAWLRGIGGPDACAVLEQAQPGSIERAVASADTFFGQELPALRDWRFDAAEAGRVGQRTLVVLGARSGEVSPTFEQRHRLLLEWLSNVEEYVLPGATHLLQAQNPSGLAEALARFFDG